MEWGIYMRVADGVRRCCSGLGWGQGQPPGSPRRMRSALGGVIAGTAASFSTTPSALLPWMVISASGPLAPIRNELRLCRRAEGGMLAGPALGQCRNIVPSQRAVWCGFWAAAAISRRAGGADSRCAERHDLWGRRSPLPALGRWANSPPLPLKRYNAANSARKCSTRSGY